ncbi:hypothetical protein [Thalassomonas actiniarum]|uniref:Uncharacterized protein n=1 Tax=Thalassomonas actiniarum TaxID=485447 RepID=A0AAF0C5H1_9GAMM|nr:hypothetical protein [Thalassomonas actiniarum]WDE01543.1 hypothetical protein SG35_013535 [Thalassomonas actiniarum]
MANPNDMPEFHSVKVSLTKNIPAAITRLPPPAYACNDVPLRHKGGCGHV